MLVPRQYTLAAGDQLPSDKFLVVFAMSPALAGHYTLETGDHRGMQALSGTYEGAHAAAGSNTAFNLATKDSIGGSVYTHDNDAYGPTPGRPTVYRDEERRSVAFTDIPPNSAANAGTGYGVVAAAAGGAADSAWENCAGRPALGRNRGLDAGALCS